MRHLFASLLASTLAVGTAAAGTPTIDGFLESGVDWVLQAEVAGGPTQFSSFGTDMDASAIYTNRDATNMYIFVQGRVNGANNDAIMLLLGTDAESGAAAGTDLGNAGSGGAFSDTGNNAWRMEFEVDYGWVANGGFSNSVFIDQASYVAGKASGYWGQPGPSGAALTDPQDLNGLNGANGPESTMAFNNSGASGGIGNSTGWEIAIPLADIGNPAATDNVDLFAVVVSAGAFFSNDSVPRDYTANPDPNHTGYNPDYLNGADFSATSERVTSTVAALPVELDGFLVE